MFEAISEIPTNRKIQGCIYYCSIISHVEPWLFATVFNRLEKMGLWMNWPEQVNWIKVVTESEMKIFWFTICSTYQQTLNKTWDRVVRGFDKVLFSWQSRQLETLAQRVEVAKTFALSKLYYVAQVLPLSVKNRKTIECSLSMFIVHLPRQAREIEAGGVGE